MSGTRGGTENGAALAYVFWHWKQPAVSAAKYEARQRAFHAALAEHPPTGFARSISTALDGAPWANGGGPAYQDRYLIQDSASLDALDACVRSGARQETHDSAASVAAGGTAGLYRARLGAPVAAPRYALWFAKPPGTTYDELLALWGPLVRGGESVLWMRRMVLGPTPEFCLESVTPLDLPRRLGAIALTLRPVWPE